MFSAPVLPAIEPERGALASTLVSHTVPSPNCTFSTWYTGLANQFCSVTLSALALIESTRSEELLGCDSVTSEGATLARKLSVSPDRKSTRLNSSHVWTSYAVFCFR